MFYVVAFGPFKIQTCYPPQNDRLSLFFVKEINVVGKKMTTNGPMNQYFNVKLSLSLTKVSFDTLEGNQLSYFQNG